MPILHSEMPKLHTILAFLSAIGLIVSWPTLFFFEVACSLIVLECTLRKIQPNIQGGGAKLQGTVLVYQCRYQILHSAGIRYCTAQFCQLLIYIPIYPSF